MSMTSYIFLIAPLHPIPLRDALGIALRRSERRVFALSTTACLPLDRHGRSLKLEVLLQDGAKHVLPSRAKESDRVLSSLVSFIVRRNRERRGFFGNPCCLPVIFFPQPFLITSLPVSLN